MKKNINYYPKLYYFCFIKYFKLNPKPMRISKKFWLLSLFVLLNFTFVAAQATDDGPEPPPPAPINQYVIIALILAIVMVFAFFSRSKKMQNSNDINL